MGLTVEQQLVVDTRKKNILVSAAAGSGKTRVLVQRIIEKILDENNPIDVDRILVVTFTNAAAAEMKERIRKEIDNAVINNPKRSDIRRQATLIHNAQIRTIDSFCSWVVKNYFYEIDQDPSFRIGSKGELSVIADDILDELLAKKLASDDLKFKNLADGYISGRKVEPLKEMVLSLYEESMSSPWPNEWFDEAVSLYDVNSIDEYENSEIIQSVIARAKDTFAVLVKKMDEAIMLYPEGNEGKDLKLLLSERETYISCINAAKFDDIFAIVTNMQFDRFTANANVLGDDKDRVKANRDFCKKNFNSLVDKYFLLNLEESYENICHVRNHVYALVEFTREYASAFDAVKKRKNIYDFNDIEHMALRILRDADDQNHSKRPVALELTNLFEEIMVDEYQDSNGLQEAILTAICKEDNYFTVGDVKQSIYSFRQAEPALFMDKFAGYVSSTEKNQRIDLDKNFRSRREVLEFCNHVFEPLMQPDMGNVAYDEAAKLKVGSTAYIEVEDAFEPEIIIGENNRSEMSSLGIKSADELEARIVANKIKQMLRDNFQVSSEARNEEDKLILRPMKLNDIVILMRSTKKHGDVFIKVLAENGIKAYVEEETGFFERDEVITVLSMLSILDNPYNDIPLAAVLHSSMFGISSEKLAHIRVTNKEASLYQCVREYSEQQKDKSINQFISNYDFLREKSLDTPIHEMIQLILDITGFGVLIFAKKGGEAAKANLDKLMDEALKFEASGSQSMNKFVQYIDTLKTYKEELGLAKTVNENDVAVRIMTIHKSKGLEFPVVFVCGATRDFLDEKGNIFFHSKYGIGLNYRNPETRIVAETIFCNEIKNQITADSFGEEQRILYVALTRAKEKLIITGTIAPTKEKTVEDIIESFGGYPGKAIDYETKLACSKGYMEWIIRALHISNAMCKKLIVRPGDLFVADAAEATKNILTRDAVIQLSNSLDKDLSADVRELIDFEYVSPFDSNRKVKYSVSEIKHAAMEQNLELMNDAVPFIKKHDEEEYVPQFMREDTAMALNDIYVPAGALYGTAMHRFMECFDFAESDFANSVKEQYEYMSKTKSLSEEEQNRVNLKKLSAFMSTELAVRMHNAAVKGALYKEQPFVLGISVNELFKEDKKTDSNTLVQGIIDVFFEEDDGIVLLDYKTDKVDESKELVLRYEEQLRLYKMALERAFDVNVKEVLIYSFSLNETISIGV